MSKFETMRSEEVLRVKLCKSTEFVVTEPVGLESSYSIILGTNENACRPFSP